MPDALTRYDSTAPRALVLMLHGGKQVSHRRVDGRSASWRRTLAMQRSLAPSLLADGVSTWVVRNRVAGWNDRCAPAPLGDARAALQQVEAELGPVPVVILGHSMGARTAVHVAGHPSVTGVVGLAPWWPEDEPVAALAGRHLVGVHGSLDRITSPAASRRFVGRARVVAASASYVDQGPVGHYMLRRPDRWNEVALRECRRLLAPALDRCR